MTQTLAAVLLSVASFVLGACWIIGHFHEDAKGGLITFSGEAYYVSPVPSHGREGTE
jgi:hypothetical protein